jgi:hypothetical protein
MTTAPTPTAAPPIGWGIWRVPERCPGCAAESLYTVFDGENTNYLCRTCSRCWYLGAGWFQRVNPLTCAGCEWRAACTSRWDVAATQMGPDAVAPDWGRAERERRAAAAGKRGEAQTPS